MDIEIKLINDGKMPVYKHPDDACADCYSNASTVIPSGARCLIPLGFCINIPTGYEAVIRPRSGNSANGIDIAIGTIDCGYTGEVSACVINNSFRDYNISKHERICQLKIQKKEEVNFIQIEDMPETKRGSNGFGSTGKL